MPFINISVAGIKLSDAQVVKPSNETTRLMSDVMHKNPSLTSVRIDHYDARNWSVGGLLLSSQGKVGVHMDIKVTDGTNTDQEKAAMIEQSMTMLKEIVGNTPEASYIIIHDLNAATWGYDGQTQLARSKHA